MTRISINNEWSCLKEAVLGMAHEMYFHEWSCLKEAVLGIAHQIYSPAKRPTEREPVTPWRVKVLAFTLYTMARGRRRVPAWITRKYAAELDALQKVLLDHGVTVHRPAPVRPSSEEPRGLGQMFPRDSIMAVGNTLILGQLQSERRRKERRGFDLLLRRLTDEGASVSSTPPDGAFIEGGDVIIDLPYVYVGIGQYASNAQGVEWLRSQLGTDVTVVPVPLAVSGILHLDCCMTLIGPRSGILHRESLVNPLPPPLGEYDFIEVDARTRQELGTNVLVLDPKTIIVQSRHVSLQENLRQRGFRVIALDFGWHARLAGAFRCATAPIRRNGSAG